MNRCVTGFADVLMQYAVCVCVFAVGAAIVGAPFAFSGVLRLPLCSWPCPPCPGMAGSFEGEEGGGELLRRGGGSGRGSTGRQRREPAPATQEQSPSPAPRCELVLLELVLHFGSLYHEVAAGRGADRGFRPGRPAARFFV